MAWRSFGADQLLFAALDLKRGEVADAARGAQQPPPDQRAGASVPSRVSSDRASRLTNSNRDNSQDGCTAGESGTASQP